jgi:hypothetical protein
MSFMLFIAGCDSSSDNLTVAPDSVVANASSVTKITFTASGGAEPYAWSISNPGIGSIAGSGTSAVYTAYAATGLNLVILTDANSNSVTASVTQGNETTGKGLAITPDAITVSASAAVTNVITFIATGGVEPYRWTIGNPTNGVLNGIGNGAVYTAYPIKGVNFVIVTDFNSDSVSATITQE